MTNSNRDVAFGKLLAIANILSQRVFEKGKPSITQKYLTRFEKQPARAFEEIHKELMEYAHNFGKDELQLLDLFGEILSEMDESDFSNDPLNAKYLHGYHSQQNVLNNVMGVETASELWGLSPGTIKNYCAQGKIKATKIGKTWVIDKTQPNPSKPSK